jgi:A/G-specific adenine glycosylase
MKFQEEIVKWYQLHKRDLPWRHTQDAYVIWLSEIIMQQTRVEQGLPYFNRFLEAFPRLEDFASATEAQVLRLWQGLGYYSRGRNMHHTAQQVLALHGGVFPVQYEELIKLKGIGAYTAAAISSFSVGESHAVVDGNVFRVLARYFGIDTPINSTAGKKEFSTLAQELMEGQNPMLYNQAIMEFGALQCKPKSPDCEVCPLQYSCEARNLNLQGTLPVKLKKTAARNRYFNYLIIDQEQQILVKKRQPGDIWQHLYDFPLIETIAEAGFPGEDLSAEIRKLYGDQVVIMPLEAKKHVLTHQIIYVQFFALANYILNFNQDAGVKWVEKSELDDLPQPKVITNFINAYLTK